MSNIYYDVRVDIQKDIVIDSGLRFTQGDSKVIYLRIAVMNGGVEFDASNTTPSVNFVKPDGTYVTGTPVKSGNFWIYQILGNELQKAGKVLCDIKFTYESGRVSSSKFTFIVEKDTTISDAEASSSYILPMEELLIEMQNYKNQGVSIVEASAVNATEAKQGATNAKNEADRAKNEADRAESFAVGGTGTRTDEDTDNAKYYKEWVEDAFNRVLPTVFLDFSTGMLMYTGSALSFDLDTTTGMLEWNM